MRKQEASNVTPLIVCGMGRSGTRNTAAVLNQHPEIRIFGEISSKTFVHFFKMLSANDMLSEKKLASWRAKKLNYIFDSFFALSGGLIRRRVPREHIIVGFKSPRSEFFFAQFEKHFASCGVAPFYVYCVRNPLDCWASYRSMPWNNWNVDQFIGLYLKSLRRLAVMRRKAGSRVRVMHLDQFLARDDPVEFYAETLFTPLGLTMSDELRKALPGVKNSNSTIAATGAERLPLPPEDADAIRDNTAIHRLLAQNNLVWPADAGASAVRE